MKQSIFRCCSCSNEELQAVIKRGLPAYVQRSRMGPVDSLQICVAVRIACENVLQARKRADWLSEVRALGSNARWSYRRKGITAFEYMLSNVAQALGTEIPPSRRQRRRLKAALKEERCEERRREAAAALDLTTPLR